MENTSLDFSGLLSESKEYIETKVELWKLKAVDKITDVISSLVAKVILIISLLCFFMMLSIGLALLIGDWLGKSMYGFFIIAAVYGIAGLVFYFFKDKLIKTPFGNKLVESFLKDDE
jgi:Putative Actinobacterial Holin-X, holin superfamily III